MDNTLGQNAVALARCRVLYIGTALPTETSEGIKAVQKPLKERYSKDGKLEGIDSRLIVYTDGIQLQFIDDQKTVIWFPILSLHVCAAVKCVNVINASTGDEENKFLPLDNINSDLKDVSPPIFAMITRRVRGIKILECHSFVCKSDAAAMALVQCCTHAYESKEESGGEGEDTLNTSQMMKQDEQGYRAWVAASQYKEVPTTPGGYYIAEGQSLVKNYGIWTNSTKVGAQQQQQQPQRARTLGPSNRPPAGPPSPIPSDGTAPRGPRIAYVPASMIRNVDARTGAGTVEAGTLNRYLQKQKGRLAPPEQDDTKSFYMYPQDRPTLSYWQAVPLPTTSQEERPNPPQRVPEPMPDHPPGAPPQRPPPSPNTRDRSPAQRRHENGMSKPQERRPKPGWDPNLRHPDGRPVTPPPDYDVDEYFEGYWHGYSEQFSKRDLNELMKKRASQALDERVQEEIIYKHDKQDTDQKNSKWKGKTFSNEAAFSRSIQSEMGTHPNRPTSAYELMELRSRGADKPFDDLDATLGYLP